MSYKLTHDALHAPNCKGGTKLVLIALADFANEMTGGCYPAHATIAKTIGCSRRAVVSAITDLEKLGYIRRGPKHGLSLSYSFAIPSTCEKSSHNREDVLCEKSSHNHPSEPVKNLHRGCEKSSQGDVKILHTNREDRIENNNKETNKLASNCILSKKIETPPKEKPQTETPKMNPQVPTPTTPTQAPSQAVTPQAPQAKPLPACPAANVSFSLRDISRAAFDKLTQSGMPKDKALQCLNAVKEEFKLQAKQLKASGFPGISNPKAYLTAKLVGMAKKGPKQAAPQAEEPTRLEEIFELLKREWEEQFPEVAAYIKCLELNDFWQNTIDALRADEVAGWSSKSGVTSVRNRLKGFVFAKVQAWRQDEIKDISSCLYHVRKALAQYRCEPKSYYNPQKTVEEEIAELEEREKKCHAELQRLRELTTRPTAA